MTGFFFGLLIGGVLGAFCTRVLDLAWQDIH